MKLIIDNVRSAYNVGAIFRSADAFEVEEIILTGITPYPIIKDDRRLPHVQDKAQRMIAKTALGAEKTIPFLYRQSIQAAITALIKKNYRIYALEQAADSTPIAGFKPQSPYALIVGNEVDGVDKQVLDQAEAIIEIPQSGQKESLNVAVATGIALFYLSTVRVELNSNGHG